MMIKAKTAAVANTLQTKTIATCLLEMRFIAMTPNAEITDRRRHRTVAANPTTDQPDASGTEAHGGGSCGSSGWAVSSELDCKPSPEG